jgi:NADH-quinone oxidoreductase subunit A
MMVAPHRPDSEKLSPYECGFEAFEDARMKFDVRYYLIAIIFILFDLEVAFLLPWATIFKEIVETDSVKWFGFIEMLVFIAILVVATCTPGPRALWTGSERWALTAFCRKASSPRRPTS